MSQKSIILIVCLFVLIVAGMFVYAYVKKSELTEVIVVPSEKPAESVPYADITRIDAKHYFIDGAHTLVGEVVMPTPCDLLEAGATVMESYPEQVMIDFSVINTAEACAQVLTAQRFKVDFTASDQASISARFIGREIELNLIPAAPGEKPEDFEVFIKG
ncbi:MAG: hypothetical protein KBC35_00270 [Candidatus Pacebacteria bacterium]|nr:hypothetical protein [Candidatus Paceibacterota bacterium]